jgi:hypothetical protein
VDAVIEFVRSFPAMALSPGLRKGLVLLILAVLVLVELSLLEECLPSKWRHAIDQQTEQIFPTGTYAPHPDLDWEFELDFRQHPWHRAVGYGTLGMLVLVDTLLIAITWRGFIRLKSTS